MHFEKGEHLRTRGGPLEKQLRFRIQPQVVYYNRFKKRLPTGPGIGMRDT